MYKLAFDQKKMIIVVAIIVLFLVLGGIALVTTGAFTPGLAVSISSFQTDKDLYHSNEIMKIQVNLSSKSNLDDTDVAVHGIKDRYGDLHLNKNSTLNLISGSNTVIFEYELPTCSRCTGIDPGDYPLNLTITRNGVQLTSGEHIVRLEQ